MGASRSSLRPEADGDAPRGSSLNLQFLLPAFQRSNISLAFSSVSGIVYRSAIPGRPSIRVVDVRE
jgi:hypothetical protein